MASPLRQSDLEILIETISSIPQGVFDLLLKEIRSPRGFDHSASRISEFDDQLKGITVDKLQRILLSLRFLYQQVRAWQDDNDTLDSALQNLFDSGLLPNRDNDALFSRLRVLLEDNLSFEREQKREWLETGILDNAVTFASFVDIRPNYDKNRTAIEELIPAIILRIGALSETGDQKSMVVQLTRSSFRKLQSAVEDIETKLKVLDNSNLGIEIVRPDKSKL